MIFVFEDYRVDVERRELRRGGAAVELQPQVFDLLVYLLHHRDRVVGKADLLEAVWHGRAVSDSALTTRINAVRRALGDDGAGQRLVRTFARKGFRFVGDVRQTSELRQASSPAPVLADGPSLAVLPFANLSNDRELDQVAAGASEEITIAVSRIRWLLVFAGEPGLADARRNPDPHQAVHASGARYILRGAVRKQGKQVRITARLAGTETSAHLWAAHFDGSLEDVFGLQDRAASSITGVIEPLLQALEAGRVDGLAADSLSAYDAYVRAFAMVFASARRIPAALALLEKAISKAPHYGPALSLAANYRMRLCMDGISSNPAADTLAGADYARRALEAAPDDPAVLANAARPLAYAGENIDATIALMDRALAVNPSFARGWYIRGFLRYWSGDSETSIEEVHRALRLSPNGRFGTPLTVIGNALVFTGRIEEAIATLRLGVQQDPSFPPNYRLLAICYAHLGRLDEARAMLARLPPAAPVSMPNIERSYRAMIRDPEQRAFALSAIRLAAGR